MVTTIQLSDKTKRKLDALKRKKHATYDELVAALLMYEKKLELREQVADYYAVYATDDAKEVNEWRNTETEDL